MFDRCHVRAALATAGLGLLAACWPLAACAADAPADKTMGDLLIEGLQLFNGEKGVELWRLKATYGRLSQNGDDVDVETPHIRYTLGDPALHDYLYVRSKQGRVTDKQRHVRLWGDVLLTHGQETATGPLLLYDSQTRVMTFPEGGVMRGPAGELSAPLLRWALDTNRLTASNGVTVVLKPRAERPEPSANPPADGALPSAGQKDRQ